MKKADITIGGKYIAKVSGKETTVRIDSVSVHGGWDATNVRTGRTVRIRTAARLRRVAETAAPQIEREQFLRIVALSEEGARAFVGADRVERVEDAGPVDMSIPYYAEKYKPGARHFHVYLKGA